MASHGVVRTQVVHQRTDEERAQEQKEIEQYKQLVATIKDELLSKEKYDSTTLNLTSQLLKRNPEYYTIWNQRRRILSRQLTDDAGTSTTKEKISNDLQFLIPLLLRSPKCYWIWNHRLWLLQQTSSRLDVTTASAFWQEELGLVSKMLARDGRNFLAWNYRRTIVAHLEDLKGRLDEQNKADGKEPTPSMIEAEFNYTTRMIKTNLSNFSAWHNRSKLIPQLLLEQDAKPSNRRVLFVKELKLIKNALSTDPYDQSLWFYHQFLMSTMLMESSSFDSFTHIDRAQFLTGEIDFMKEMLDDTDDCKWLYQYLLTYTAKYLELDAGYELIKAGDMRLWLAQLKKLDPLREGKWKSMEQQLKL